MAFDIPQSRRQLQLIVPQKRQIPLDQIIAIQGQNPVANGIAETGKVLGDALMRRAQLQMQGQQTAQLAAMAQGNNPTNPSVLTPDLFEKGSALQVNAAAKKSSEAASRVDRELKLEQLKAGYSQTDPMTGAVRTYPGVQGLSIAYDQAGNPFVQRNPDTYAPKMQPIKGGGSGSGSGGGSDDKEWGKLVKDVNPQTASSRSTLGITARANLSADRAIATLSKPMVTKAELGNAMADIAAIYQGGAPTDTGMSHQDWSTLYGKVTGAMQSLTGNPTDTVPDAIKQRMLGDLADMKNINNRSISNNLDFIEKGRAGIVGRHASEWKNMRSQLEGGNAAPLSLLPMPGTGSGLSPAAQSLINKHRGQ